MIFIEVILFFTIPAAAIAFFVVSLCLFLSARKQNKRQPGSIDEKVWKTRKIMLIVSAAVAGVLVAIVIAFIITLFFAAIYM